MSCTTTRRKSSPTLKLEKARVDEGPETESLEKVSARCGTRLPPPLLLPPSKQMHSTPPIVKRVLHEWSQPTSAKCRKVQRRVHGPSDEHSLETARALAAAEELHCPRCERVFFRSPSFDGCCLSCGYDDLRPA